MTLLIQMWEITITMIKKTMSVTLILQMLRITTTMIQMGILDKDLKEQNMARRETAIKSKDCKRVIPKCSTESL